MWILKFLINSLFWLQAFVAPVILFALIGLAVKAPERLFIVLLCIGAMAGIIIAEYIRRKIGLDTFFARIYGSNEMDEKSKRKNY